MLIYKIKDVLKFVMAFMTAGLFRIAPKNRDIWIITERRNECKDNGFYLFKYIRQFHPEQKVYYAIEKDSPQRSKIEKYGNIIDYNSLRHYIFALMATRLIGAFLPCGIPDSVCFYKFPNLVKGKKVFLQHGITKECIPSLFFENTKADLFICGAEPEYEFIKNSYHYPDGNVVYTGLCRFDGLSDFQTEKMILLMPTWRKWIPSATWHDGECANPEEYEYFSKYKELITNSNVRNILKINGYKMCFYIHHELQPYMDYFGGSDDTVILATELEYDVQALLKSCACLITDYSSVAFDVAYMHKPVIYYQFDEKRYYSEHYNKGYFDYETMGFGMKCSKLEELENQIVEVINNKCTMESGFEKRVSKFFAYNDSKNCERVYQAIVDVDK